MHAVSKPQDYQFEYGKGAVIEDGGDAVAFGYGPVMLNEALTASETLKSKGISLKVVNLPWLNRIDPGWLEETIGNCETVFAIDDHSFYGGLGDHLLNAFMASNILRKKRLIKFGIEEHAACGTPPEALRYHKMDGASLATRIMAAL